MKYKVETELRLYNDNGKVPTPLEKLERRVTALEDFENEFLKAQAQEEQYEKELKEKIEKALRYSQLITASVIMGYILHSILN